MVVYTPEFFGSKPEMIIKGGTVAYCNMGDPNASIPTTEPVLSRPMFGMLPSVTGQISCLFVSQLSIDSGVIDTYNLKKKIEPVKNCRNIGKKDMKLNDCMPVITVDPETYQVTADGQECTCEPVSKLPLTQSIFIF